MSNFSRNDALVLRQTLNRATIQCSDRCLYQAARWAAELSDSLSAHFDDDTDSDSGSNSGMDEDQTARRPSRTDLATNMDRHEARLEAKELTKYLLAKAHFDCREFERCAAVFLPPTQPRMPLSFRAAGAPAEGRPSDSRSRKAQPGVSATQPTAAEKLPRLSQKSLFLALYGRYMAGEKRRDEESETILGPSDKGSAVNKELVGITKILEDYFGPRETARSGGGFLEFLYGVVLAKGKNELDARYWLIKSLFSEPCNWSAWLELSSLIGSVEELHAASQLLPQHLCTVIFHLYVSQELYQTTESTYRQLAELENIFHHSSFLKTQRAMLFYHAKDFEEAEQTFAELVQDDPFRLDYLDNYSNVLYVLGERPKLAFLAQVATHADKFRPETCCIVGNYFSLKSEHEKAVQYFRRALTLDRHFLAAWTLMGHEYVEMKNTHAAIESYRRAVDVDRKDYRAWYGLGQTYEVLEMHLYALNYYRRAALLRPYDSKMWNAVGKCYDKIGKPLESIKAYKRALAVNTFFDSGGSFASDGIDATAPAGPDGWTTAELLFQIAQMYERTADIASAADYMTLVMAQEDHAAGEAVDEDGGPRGIGVTTTTSKARLWLAHHALGRNQHDRAMELANELCQDGYEVEDAKAIIRAARSKIEERGEDGDEEDDEEEDNDASSFDGP